MVWLQTRLEISVWKLKLFSKSWRVYSLKCYWKKLHKIVIIVISVALAQNFGMETAEAATGGALCKKMFCFFCFFFGCKIHIKTPVQEPLF